MALAIAGNIGSLSNNDLTSSTSISLDRISACFFIAGNNFPSKTKSIPNAVSPLDWSTLSLLPTSIADLRMLDITSLLIAS